MSNQIVRDFQELMESVLPLFPEAEVFEDEDGIVCINTGLVLDTDGQSLIPLAETPEVSDGLDLEFDGDLSLDDLE